MILHSIEIRPVENGFIVILTDDEDTTEYVFDSHHKTLRFIKAHLEPVNDR